MNTMIAGWTGLLGNSILAEMKTRAMINLHTPNREILGNLNRLESFVSEKEIDVIINCIAIPSNRLCMENCRDGFVSNIMIPTNILSAAKKKGCKVVQFSSHAVFPPKSKLTYYYEGDSPDPDTFYGDMKLYLEKIGTDLIGSNCITVRLPMLFGPRFAGRKNFGLLDRFIKKIIQEEDININPGIVDSPSYSVAISKFLTDFLVKMPSANGVIHIANEGICSLLEFCEEVKILAGSRSTFSILEKVDGRANETHLECRALKQTYFEGIEPLPNWKISLKHFLETM